MDKTPQEVKIDINPEVAKGTYSNLVMVTHSPTEVVIDFAQMFPGTPNPVVRDRIVMNPVHAKRFLSALAENIQKYEQNFGPIVEPRPQTPTVVDPSGRNGNIPFDMGPMGEA